MKKVKKKKCPHDWEYKLEIDEKGICKPISYKECRICGLKLRVA